MITVQTPSGDKDIFSLSYGDLVYNIHGDTSRVIGDKYYNKILLLRVYYSDDRYSIHSINDMIYTKRGKIPLKMLCQNMTYPEVRLHEVKYRDKLKFPMQPDPYVAGAFLTYGDFSEPYLNLPVRLSGINHYLANKYQLEHAMIMIKDLVVYQKVYTTDIIIWKDFFNDQLDHEFLTTGILPLYIRRSSVNDRYQYIRGIFDMGYSKEIFSESECGVGHWDEKRLKQVQRILWSLGIKSKIEPYNVKNRFKWKYRLKIMERMEMFPSLFYNLRTMERLITNRTSVVKYPMPVPPLRLIDITVEGEGSYRELILDKPAIMIDQDFLPRVSL